MLPRRDRVPTLDGVLSRGSGGSDHRFSTWRQHHSARACVRGVLRSTEIAALLQVGNRLGRGLLGHVHPLGQCADRHWSADQMLDHHPVGEPRVSESATVGPDLRPRTRILHPLWELDAELVGWIVTRVTPVKVRHLAYSPYLSCSYREPGHEVAVADCRAEWVGDTATRQRVWELYGMPRPHSAMTSGVCSPMVRPPVMGPPGLD